jgi:hydroxyacylglutathione hydrolase
VSPLLKRVLLGVGVPNKPIADGQTVVPGVTVVKDGFVDVSLIDVAPGQVALIDAGNDTLAKPILEALAARKLSASSVVAIFLTHGHPDHTAGAKQFPAAKVYAMAEDVALAGDAATVTNPLKDGDVVTVGDTRVEAFATPGHTPGSAVYFAKGVLFFGDSARATKEGAMLQAVSLMSKNSGQNVASLVSLAKRLAPRAAEVKALEFAHSGTLDGFAPLADFAKAHGGA